MGSASINILGFNVGDLTTAIKNAGAARDAKTLGVKVADALDRHDEGLTSILEALQGVADADARLPILIRDRLGNVVGTLGYKEYNNTAIYGLTVDDQRGNLAAFVGVQTEVPLPITATTNANPDVITVPGHTFVNGDTVLNEGALGDTAINIIGIVQNANIGAGTFTMTDLAGAVIGGSGAYTGSGTCQRFYGGGKFQTVSIGTNGQIRAFADGRVLINGANVMLNANGVTTTIGNLNIGGAFGIAGLDVKNNAASSQDVLVTDTGFLIRATDQIFAAASLQAPGDIGHLALKKLGASFLASLDAQLGLVITDNSGNTGRMKATQLLLQTGGVTTIFADATTPEIDLGAAGAAQSILNDNTLRTQDAANVIFSMLRNDGAVSGNDTTGTWSLQGPGLLLSGNRIVGLRGASVSDVTLVTTETATGSYTATEQSMLNHLKTDVTSLKTQLNAWLARARIATGHGLIS